LAAPRRLDLGGAGNVDDRGVVPPLDLFTDRGEPKLIWRAKATTALAHLLIWSLSLPASTSFNGAGPMLSSSPEKQRPYRAAFCFLFLLLPPPPLGKPSSSLTAAPSPLSPPSSARRAGSDLLPTDMDDAAATSLAFFSALLWRRETLVRPEFA